MIGSWWWWWYAFKRLFHPPFYAEDETRRPQIEQYWQ